MSAQAEDADMPPLADAPPVRPAEESKQPETTKEEEEGSDEDAPLIEPLTILKLLHGFCGDGTQVPEADKREKAGQLLWDLSATKAHACVIGPHASTLLDTARGAPDRVAEVALGIYTNVCGWLPDLAKSEDARELVATALVGSEDPGLLTESLRLMQTCFLVLREERDRSKLLKPFADAWASLAISLKTRVLFCIENSLDARLVARALELAFAARFFPDHDGDCDVFDALCVEDALLKAVLDALQDVGSEDLHATKLDEHGDGLDSALRVWRGVPFRCWGRGDGVPRRQQGQRKLGGRPRRRVLSPAAEGRMRCVRVGCGSALVHGRGGHDGMLLGRLHCAAGCRASRRNRERGCRQGGAQPPRRLRGVRHRRSRQRRHALDGWIVTRREPRVGRVAARLARRAPRAVDTAAFRRHRNPRPGLLRKHHPVRQLRL